MRTKFIAAAVATCFAIPAMAQSSVTVYGIADAGVMYAKNGGADSKLKLVSGIADGSRLGFKGTEDLGGGFKAVFTLEARVEMDNGEQQTGHLSSNEGFALTRGLTFTPVLFGASRPAVSAAVSAGVVANAKAQGASDAMAQAAATAYLASATGIADVDTRTNAAIAPTAAALLAGTRLGVRTASGSKLVNPNKALFDRTSMVGLVTPVGAVLLGRMYTPAYEIFNIADTFESGTAGGWGNITGGSGGLLTAGIAIRSDKAIQYRIQTPGGIHASMMYGFKNSGYIGQDKRFIAGMVKYKANGFDMGIGYNNGDDQVGNPGLITTVAGGSYEIGDLKFFAGLELDLGRQRRAHPGEPTCRPAHRAA